MTDWEEEWRAAHQRSPVRTTPQNEERWKEFWSQDSDYYLQESKAEAGFHEKVVERMAETGWLRPDDAVLDVGCGPGTLALPMARRVREVHALDEAEGMLETLRQECGRRGIANITTLLSPWKEHSAPGAYDLVFASLSPAIRSGEDLMAMERASRDRCCLIVPCPSDTMATRNELWELVVGEFRPSDAYSAKYPLNVLREKGRDPVSHRVTGEVEYRRPTEDVIDHYLRYFRIFTEMTPEKEERVRRHFLHRSVDGFDIGRSGKCLELICWKV
jgi:SAM-dependent methyltransferase